MVRNSKPVSVKEISSPLFHYASSNGEAENSVTKRNDNNKITESRHQSAKIQHRNFSNSKSVRNGKE